MNDVNWWLMALAFILGLLLTFAFLIRRVTREVPIYAPLGRGPNVDVKAPNVSAKAADVPDVDVKAPDVDLDAPTTEVKRPDVNLKGAGLAAGATAAGAAAAAKLTGGAADIADEAPYGTGSVRLKTGSATGPSGYDIKGNEDSMLYHTTASPFYDATIAEVWFKEAGDAERAGFTRWDAVGGKGSGGAAAGLADIPPGPFGVGSAKAGPGGTGPEGWLIKGNEDSMLYHTTASPSYQQTIAEVWFVDEATAEKAGFKKYK